MDIAHSVRCSFFSKGKRGMEKVSYKLTAVLSANTVTLSYSPKFHHFVFTGQTMSDFKVRTLEVSATLKVKNSSSRAFQWILHAGKLTVPILEFKSSSLVSLQLIINAFKIGSGSELLQLY